MASHPRYVLYLNCVDNIRDKRKSQIRHTRHTTSSETVFHLVICHSIANNNIFILQFATFGASIPLYWSIYRGHELNIILFYLCCCKRKIGDKISSCKYLYVIRISNWHTHIRSSGWSCPAATAQTLLTSKAISPFVLMRRTVGSKAWSMAAITGLVVLVIANRLLLWSMCAAAFGEFIDSLAHANLPFSALAHRCGIISNDIRARNMHIFQLKNV